MNRAVSFVVAVVVSSLVVGPGIGRADPAPGTTRRLGDSSDVVDAAIDVSQGTWEDDDATIVVLGRDDVFADSLAGAVLAGTAGPVLFTDGGPSAVLRPSVRAEIERVLPAPSGCDGSSSIVLLGGTSAVSPAVESELAGDGWCVERVAGATRVGTAVAVGERAPDPSRVLLARSDSWFDAAAAGAYAAATGHPILITPGDALGQAVQSFLAAAAPAEIVLLGGTGALSSTVEAQAAGYAPVRRVQGTTRDATAVAVADELWGELDPSGVTVVNGFVDAGWAYALAGSVTAAVERAPVLFSTSDDHTDAGRAYVDRVSPAFTVAVGPPGVLGAVVAEGGSAGDDWHLRPIPASSSSSRYASEVFDSIERTNDITYGTAVDQEGATVTLRLDLYEPAGDSVARRPAIVWIHGGGFSGGDRTSGEIVDQATVFAGAGFVNASISYRLHPAGCSAAAGSATCIVAIQQAMEDAQAAVRFLRAHADDYGIDVDRIAIAGTSAGAITALNVGYETSETASTGSGVQAAVSLSGANLLGRVSAGDAPALWFHGDADSIVPYEWATADVTDSRAAGLVANLTTWPGQGHVPYGSFRDDIIDQTRTFLWWTLALAAANT